MSPSHEFTTEHVDTAIDFLISKGAEDRGQTVSYSRVFAAAGLSNPQNLHDSGESRRVTQFMAAFHHRCKEQQLPPLDALVVHVAGTAPDSPAWATFGSTTNRSEVAVLLLQPPREAVRVLTSPGVQSQQSEGIRAEPSDLPGPLGSP
ncbi:hypothetical protein DLJ47_23570 [Micromonospora sp. S4605]|uniref:hypothetical protein n=1 Tax=Micromonospora sp. S4605 TaxID=1420897 RepID=UPI000D6F6ABF|nr:hypothetical protein [Micromonospora sp. S4605]PWU50669.1 hypothetical protein DLJ47_23570 [Micromonospora sp. S4605]